MFADLQAAPGAIHPIVQADAIKFLYTFRMQVGRQTPSLHKLTMKLTVRSRQPPQLNKEQLLAVMPLLIPHLQNPSFVIHTYAALTIERILFIKKDSAFM